MSEEQKILDDIKGLLILFVIAFAIFAGIAIVGTYQILNEVEKINDKDQTNLSSR